MTMSASTTTVRTTLGQLVAADAALARLAQLALPVKAAYHLKKLRALAGAELKLFYEQRLELAKMFGTPRAPTPDESARLGPSDVYDVQGPALGAFNEKFAELCDVQVQLACGPFELSWLGELPVTTVDLEALGLLVALAEEAAAPVT
jgi:hypothetical protein